MIVRTEPSLKESFEKALAAQKGFSSRNAFFEDCMRAMILSVRDGKELEVPLGFLERKK